MGGSRFARMTTDGAWQILTNSDEFCSNAPSQEREARLRARTICSQIAKVTGKLMGAAQQLEVEAGAAREAHEADVAGWVTRLRVLGSKMAAQQEALATALLIELDHAEIEHTRHARTLQEALETTELQRLSAVIL